MQSFTVLSGYKRNQIAFFNQYLQPQFRPPFPTPTTMQTPTPTPTMMTTSAATATQASAFDFKTATFALMGVSGGLLLVVIVMFTICCCGKRSKGKYV